MIDVDEASSPPATPEKSGVGWFVYGVIAAGTELPRDLVGLDQEPVMAHRHGLVAVLASRVTIDRPPGRGADLMAYNSVLEAMAHAEGSVIPVQFGAVLPDETSLVEEFLAPDESYFAELLESLRGRAQYMLHGMYDEQAVLSEIVEDDPEIAELRAATRDLPEEARFGDRVRLGELVSRAVEERRAVDAAALLDDVLPLVDAYVERPVSGLERVIDVALLVADARREELEESLERLAETVHPRIRLRLLGPTVPFDFVGGG